MARKSEKTKSIGEELTSTRSQLKKQKKSSANSSSELPATKGPVEPVVKFNTTQFLVNALEWIKFKANRGMLTEQEMEELFLLVEPYKHLPS